MNIPSFLAIGLITTQALAMTLAAHYINLRHKALLSKLEAVTELAGRPKI